MTKPTIAITIGQAYYPRMFSQAAWDALDTFANVIHHEGPEPTNKDELIALIPEADAIITSWGVAQLDADVMAAAPRLQAMAHMGSSVKRFVSDAFWARGVQLTSAGIALARHVAETTLGLMIVGQKRIWPLGQLMREGGWRDDEKWESRELFRKQVGIIGASNIGRYVIRLLEPFEVTVLLYDPFVSEAQAAELGATKLELDDLLRRADIVSLHAPSNAQTHHMLNAARLKLMKDDALLINTARGTLIEEPALVEELSNGRFFAFLDVTDPEPTAADSPLRSLPNVVVTPHIAGCIENCNRMGELAVEELRRFFAGETAVYQITREMFERIA
ncbi:MAG: hydroxyacid dehydrogenase [Ardenticatenaceae bacterium]|nr:hydroxyacid dehydrogenase [Ardenticatenaceae bacterium]MCB9003340.1 hydroxyacid dehydrogenase [Ardenticatenaceae bacterium]